MNAQLDLFAAAPVAAVPRRGRRSAAETPAKRLGSLRSVLASELLTLDGERANLSEVCLHLNASGEGLVTGDWWEGAVRFGALDADMYRDPKRGRYPRKARRWLRRLVRGLLVDILRSEALTAELTAQVNALAALVEPLTLNRDSSAR